MFDSLPKHSDVIIIGAGPAGAAMASRLADKGVYPLIIERDQFPRFTIGESLLPEAINCLETVGLLDAVESAGFQYKNGALFATNEQRFELNFADGFSPGRDYAFQVPRADFDLRLINCCISKGVQVIYQTSITDIAPIDRGYSLTLESNGESRKITSSFLVDASGFGRVLAKKFELDRPSNLADKRALFCHIESDLESTQFDRNKILIAQTHLEKTTWYWVIPFTGKRCSVGVVTDCDKPISENGLKHDYQEYISKQNLVSELVGGGTLLRQVGCVSAYSSSISSLYGHRYVILGNAGEFIDPIFSSGVTIALKSAVLAAPLVLETVKQNAQVDWMGRFQHPLMEGINTFREYVLAWYAGILPNLFYSPRKNTDVSRMICSILAGYAWDRSNPFTKMTVSRLESLLVLNTPGRILENEKN